MWGCGPVAQFAIRSAWMFRAGRVIAIDRVAERLRMAETHGKAEATNSEREDIYGLLMDMTQGRGPERCIDAVGAEAHGTGLGGTYDKAMQAVRSCRKGGTVSISDATSGSATKPRSGRR